MRTLRTLLFTAALAVALPPVPTHDTVINLPYLSKLGPIVVTTTVDEDNDDGDCSLREAIRAVNSQSFVDACGSGLGNNEIYVPAGVYNLTIKGDAMDDVPSSALHLLVPMSIKGAGRDTTVIDAGSRFRVFFVGFTSGVLLASLKIQNGRAPDAPPQNENANGYCNMVGEDGGAIYNIGVLMLNDVAVRNSHAGAGASSLDDPDCEPGDGYGGKGGGIYSRGPLTLSGVLFEGNASGAGGAGVGGSGGAIYNAGSTVVATTSIFSHNSAGEGGSFLNVPFRYGFVGGYGGAVANIGTLNVTSSSFVNNMAGAGGTNGSGSHAYGASGGFGGALDNEIVGTVTIVASTFAYNQAGKGGASTWSGSGGAGGAINNFGQMEITNSTISNNAAGNGGDGDYRPGNGGSGGGIVSDGSLRISASTVTQNRAGEPGTRPGGGSGGPGSAGGLLAVSDPVIRGLILAGNIADTGPECIGTLDSRGYNLISSVAGCTIAGTTTGNITGRSPKLGPLADNGGGTLTHMPGSNSPALNASICQTVDDQPLLYDQRWVQRPHGSTCDIGSVER